MSANPASEFDYKAAARAILPRLAATARNSEQMRCLDDDAAAALRESGLASVLTPEPGLGVPDVGLGDVLPDPANIPPGCRFHPRCPIAEKRCSTETPPLRPRPGGGGVECLLVP